MSLSFYFVISLSLCFGGVKKVCPTFKLRSLVNILPPDFTDLTLADEDTNSIQTDDATLQVFTRPGLTERANKSVKVVD